jgi:hypothetical protein
MKASRERAKKHETRFGNKQVVNIQKDPKLAVIRSIYELKRVLIVEWIFSWLFSSLVSIKHGNFREYHYDQLMWRRLFKDEN